MLIKEKLIQMGLDGNGKNVKGSISKTKFENATGVCLTSDMFNANEYGTQDAKIWITEENGEEFSITIEINEEGEITHSYY